MIFFYVVRTDKLVVGYACAESHLEVRIALSESYKEATSIEAYSVDDAMVSLAKLNKDKLSPEWIDMNLKPLKSTWKIIHKLKETR